MEWGAANRVWLAQAFALARAQKLAGVLIVIHGNPEFEAASAGHPKPGYRDFVDQPLLDSTGRALVKNFTRVETRSYP